MDFKNEKDNIEIAKWTGVFIDANGQFDFEGHSLELIVHQWCGDNTCIDDDQLLYHMSWDWLMPVIEKITNECEEPAELDDLKYSLLTNNIEEAHKFVVDYISK